MFMQGRKCFAVISLLLSSGVFSLAAGISTPRKQADELFTRRNYAEAATVYERLALDRTTDKQLVAYALFRVGLCRLKEQRNSEAFSTWTRLRTLNPTSEYTSLSLWQESQATTGAFRARTLREEVLAK